MIFLKIIINHKVGQKIRYIRRGAALSLKEAAELINVNWVVFWAYEAGFMSMPCNQIYQFMTAKSTYATEELHFFNGLNLELVSKLKSSKKKRGFLASFYFGFKNFLSILYKHL